MTIRSLPAFLLIAFGMAWTIIGLSIFYTDQTIAAFGPISERHPLFILSVYSPAIAALVVVFHAGGSEGFKRYLSRLFLWRCARPWYAFLRDKPETGVWALMA
jgi:uncharacterized protein